MKKHIEQSGFSTVELLITLFIAAAFLISGFQLYAVIIKNGSEVRAKIKASNVVYDYLERYKSSATTPCTALTPLVNTPITVDTLSNVTVSVTISCPYSSTTSVSKVLVTVNYNQPQQTISNATYVNL
jgi:Tfp pilus assembly protein PilV